MAKRKILALLIFFNCFGSYSQSDLNYFAGTWDFDIVFEGNTTGKPDISAKWFVEKGLREAFCLIGHVEIEDDTFTREMIAYNPDTKQYIRTIATNGGSWLQFTSTGWQGDTLIWSGSQIVEGETVQLREEIVRESPVAFTARYYNWRSENWVLLQTETLKRIKTTHQE